MELKHFKLSEFDSPDAPGSGSNMKPEFLQRLDNARGLAGIPFKINSGFRTKARNAIVKGRNRLLMVKALLAAGFTRIGIADGFIHVDCDPQKSKEAIWLY